MARKSFHIFPNSQGAWVVRATGSVRAAKVCQSESEAIAHVRSKSAEPIYIHRRDGLIARKEMVRASIPAR